jgi:methionyl aminopeptidase
MKTNIPKGLFNETSIITLKGVKTLKSYRAAGKIAAAALVLLEGLVKDKTIRSLLELDRIAEEFIITNKGIPTFKGYHGFPNAVCISVNKQLVHGIPSKYVLQEGDVVSFDLGVTIDGCVADTAITCIYGEPNSQQQADLVKCTEKALNNGIAAIKIGNRLGCIGDAIYRTAKKHNLAVVESYGGHGLDTAQDGTGIPHAPPFVCNRDIPDNGIHIENGLVIAIEPLFVIGSSNKTIVADDKWTVITQDISSHHEHTIFVHDNYAEIITDRSNL